MLMLECDRCNYDIGPVTSNVKYAALIHAEEYDRMAYTLCVSCDEKFAQFMANETVYHTDYEEDEA